MTNCLELPVCIADADKFAADIRLYYINLDQVCYITPFICEECTRTKLHFSNGDKLIIDIDFDEFMSKTETPLYKVDY